MAGGGWQHLAVAAKELAGATGTKAKAVTQTLGKAVVGCGGQPTRACHAILLPLPPPLPAVLACLLAMPSTAAPIVPRLHSPSLQLATSKEVRHLVLDDGTEQPGDGQHVQGPFDQSQEPQVVVDAYGFSLTVMPDQAAILERCRARQEAVRQKWAQHVQEGGLPPPDALKKLCRKVSRAWLRRARRRRG